MTQVAWAPDSEEALEIAVPAWYQEWWSAALELAVPIFLLLPALALCGAGGAIAWIIGTVLVVVGLASGAYGVYAWLAFLTTGERMRVALAVLGYALLALGVNWVVVNAELNYRPEVVKDYIFSDLILKGAWRTVYLSVVSQLVGIALGLMAALGKLSRNPLFNGISTGYIWFFRGTPLLVQLLFWFAALPQIIPAAVNITPFQAAVIGLGVNEGAYMAEIVRAGIQSVDPGQIDAGKSLGMTYPLTMRKVVLPQAMRVIIPPTGNNFISMLKSSSLAAVITFEELFRTTQTQISTTFRSLELLTVASIWYLVMTSIFSTFQVYLERRFSSGYRRDARRRGVFETVIRSLGGRRV